METPAEDAAWETVVLPVLAWIQENPRGLGVPSVGSIASPLDLSPQDVANALELLNSRGLVDFDYYKSDAYDPAVWALQGLSLTKLGAEELENRMQNE